MSLINIPIGDNIPDDIYSIIEISLGSYPIKYEYNINYGALFVDRFIDVPMYYPCNYGYINNTLSKDNDPLDVLVISLYPLIPKSVIHTRPIGILNLIDESGEDNKILSVPNYDVSEHYNNIQDIYDVDKNLLNKISYFFENYKFLEKNKWIENKGWKDVHEAKKIITSCIKIK